MDNPIPDASNMALDGKTRAERWKSLRLYLKRFMQAADHGSDRLAALEREAADIRSESLLLAEAIQCLDALASEEVQREKSLMLNDIDFDIVLDEPSDAPSPHPQLTEKPNANPHLCSLSELPNELEKLPGIGPKNSRSLADYITNAGDDEAERFLLALAAVNGRTRQDLARQSLFDFEQDPANPKRGEKDE